MGRTASERMGAQRKLQPMRRVLGGSRGPARLDEVTADKAAKLGDVVCNLVGAGFGIILAPTRDGGALSITLLDGDDREKGYAGDSEQLDGILEALDDQATARRLGGTNGE